MGRDASHPETGRDLTQHVWNSIFFLQTLSVESSSTTLCPAIDSSLFGGATDEKCRCPLVLSAMSTSLKQAKNKVRWRATVACPTDSPCPMPMPWTQAIHSICLSYTHAKDHHNGHPCDELQSTDHEDAAAMGRDDPMICSCCTLG